MAHIENKDIRKELRFVGSAIRRIMPVFTKEQLVKLSAKCEKFLAGKWLGKHTTVETRYIERPDGTKMRTLICRSKDGVKPDATGLLWIHGGRYAIGAPEQDFFYCGNSSCSSVSISRSAARI